MPARVDRLTPEQEAMMGPWADRWITVGQCTDPADWESFEAAAEACYGFAGVPWPGRVVRVSSPIVGAFAAPIVGGAVDVAVNAAVNAAVSVAVRDAVNGAVSDAVNDTVNGAVRDAVNGAVSDAVNGAVSDAVNDTVGGAVRDAVSDAVDVAVSDAVSDAVNDTVNGAVRDAVSDAVDVAVSDAVNAAVNGAVRDAVDVAVSDAVNAAVNGAVRDAVSVAVRGAVVDAVGVAVDGAVSGAVAVSDAVNAAVNGAVRDAVNDAVRDAVSGALDEAAQWWRYLGGQFWAGGWWMGSPAVASFFREVCELDLPGDTWDRAKAWQQTVESACWWWPTQHFVMVSDRPCVLHLEETGSGRGWDSHQLHCDTGPAVAWRDGWGVWAIHGVRVPQQVVEAPDTLTPQQILTESNAEVRRVMMDRFGAERLAREGGATLVHEDLDELGHPRKLWRLDIADDEPVVMVELVNSTPEPDGERKHYWLRVPPGTKRAGEAAAWTWGMPESEYVLEAQS